MPIDYDVSDAPRFVKFTLRGDFPSIDEQGQLRRDLAAAGQFGDRTCALVDLRWVHAVPPYTGIQQIVDAALKDHVWPLRQAYLVGSATQFGFVRQLQVCSPPETVVALFTSEIEAAVWASRIADAL